MRKSKAYLYISVISYICLMILNKLFKLPDIIYLMIMTFSITLIIIAIKEQKKERGK